ncbi:MAG: response regulator transcription factor [Candidatus Gracilibacteria bacterium]|nr:response regulator transcription factor [Candidatus Gracilibacteria bacterium]
MKIIIIEDEKILATKIAKKLKNLGFNIKIYNDINSFMKSSDIQADLYIIDVLLSDGTGLSILDFIRKNKKYQNPIIMISGFESIDNKIYSLNIGADDFIMKPFSPDELIARINAIMRRNSHINSKEDDIYYKNIKYSYTEHKVLKDGIEIHLGLKEKQIVEYFIKNKGKVVTKDELVQYIWGEYNETFVTNNTINVTLHKIRNKLGSDFELETLHSEGYQLKI